MTVSEFSLKRSKAIKPAKNTVLCCYLLAWWRPFRILAALSCKCSSSCIVCVKWLVIYWSPYYVTGL